MKLALGIVTAATITAALGEGPGTTPGQDRTAEAPARHEAGAPEDALHESIRGKFVQDRFLEPSEAAGYPPKAMMGFTSSDRCPDGWEQVRAEDGAPLFHAFGLLVDAGGTRRSGYIRVPACMKRQLRGAPDAGAHRRRPAARLRLRSPARAAARLDRDASAPGPRGAQVHPAARRRLPALLRPAALAAARLQPLVGSGLLRGLLLRGRAPGLLRRPRQLRRVRAGAARQDQPTPLEEHRRRPPAVRGMAT